MKKLFALFAAMTLLIASGCGASSEKGGETVQEDTIQEDTVQELTGTLDDVKDFMFVVTDSTGVSYSLSFEETPEGLAECLTGTDVTVRYTGKLSEVDAFTGEILSVQPAD